MASTFGEFLNLLLLKDWGLKFICLFLATLYWLYIDGQLTDTREVDVRLHLENMALPDGLKMVEPERAFLVRVRVRGSRQRLPFLEESNLALVRMEELIPNPKAGLQVIRLEPEHFKVVKLQGMDVVGVDRKEIRVHLFMPDQKALTVFFKQIGKPPQGYRVEPEILPTKVTVTASEPLAHATRIFTEPVDVSRPRDQDMDLAVASTISVGEGDQRREIRVECDQKIRLKLRFVREQTQQRFENVPVLTLQPPGTTMEVTPAQLNVLVKGSPGTVSDLTQGTLRLQLFVEWDTNWETRMPANQFTEFRAVQVKFVPYPGLSVTDNEGKPLSVKIRGAWTGLIEKP